MKASLSNLSTAQFEHLFTAIAQKESPMKELIVVGFCVTDLSPALFASAVSNVKELKLSFCSEDHMLALLQEIVENERSLTKLDLSGCCMNYIDPGLVGKALNKLEAVTFEGCKFGWFSHDLVTATLRGVFEDESRLKQLVLNDISSSFLRGLDVELLRQAAKKIGIKTRKVVDAYQMELRRLGAISIFD